MRSTVSLMCSASSSSRSRSRARKAQGPGEQLLGRLALGLSEQLVGLGRVVTELEEALAGEDARVGALAPAGDDRLAHDAAGVGFDAHLLAQLDDDPLRRAL